MLATVWDSPALRIKRKKCVVSGCEIPARGRVGQRLLTEPWTVCGIHRKPVCEMLNKAHEEKVSRYMDAQNHFTCEIVNGLDAMGDHENELFLAG